MNVKIKKAIVLSLVGGFIIQLAACGTIIHPERKGQKSGQLDTSIVVLDAIGLLFFFVPGIIAFAVDFNNGTIYLPGGSASINSNDVNVVNIEGDVTDEKIEKLILKETGKSIRLDDKGIHSLKKVTTLSALKNDIRFL
ncbi:MAG: polyribonucleotide nucleotidyltransferase [Oceanicoccus sp.]